MRLRAARRGRRADVEAHCTPGQRRRLRRRRPRARRRAGAAAAGRRDASAGRATSDRILADACEALMAALYLDGGLEAARMLFAGAWKRGARRAAATAPVRDPKSRAAGMGGARARPAPRYATAGLRGRAATTRRCSPSRWTSTVHAPRGERRARASARPRRRPPARPARQTRGRQAWPASRRGRLRRRDRRAQRRQVDPGQPPGRLQGLHRHPEGADHALSGARRGHGGRQPDRAGRHARHLQPAPPARPGHGARRLGAAPRTPTPSCIWSTPRPNSPPPRRQAKRGRPPRRRGRAHHHRGPEERRPPGDPGAEQDRPRAPRRPAGADPEAFRARRLRRGLHDLGRRRLRRRRSEAPAGRADAGRPWLYPEDQSADLPARLLAAEITREKVYLRVHEELPYAASVETTAFEERQDGSARIEQTIYVERDSQRAIVLGKGGQTLKWIGEASRKELAEILGPPGPPVPARQGQGELGRGARLLPRPRPGFRCVARVWRTRWNSRTTPSCSRPALRRDRRDRRGADRAPRQVRRPRRRRRRRGG